jgi:phosphohistidine swiveling domain-containing protein
MPPTSPTSTFPIYAIHLHAELNLAECGGKAFHLNQMLHRQFPVPPGIVVTNQAFQAFLNQNGLRTRIETHLQTVDLKIPESCQTAAKAIHEAVHLERVPEAVLDAIVKELAILQCVEKLIIRSSAVGEDSAHAAFAGQLDSILHIEPTVEAVGQALKACWASYWSARVLFYQRSRGVSLNGMGVVIQSQVVSAISGVLFTQQPAMASAVEAPNADASMLVEFCEGLGDQLVAGSITPGRGVLCRRTSTWNPSVWPPETLDHDRLTTLCSQLMPQLAAYGLELESVFGGPQDIEWTATEAGQLFLVQSRPITAFGGTSGMRTGTENPVNPASPKVVWSNANVNENFPDPICPLLYSIASLGYYHYFRNLGIAFGISRRRIDTMELPLRNIVGVHSARLYYNLTNIHAVLRIAPFGEMLTESFNLFVGSVQTERINQRLTWSGFARGWLGPALEAVIIAARTTWKFLTLPGRIARFERTVDEFAARTRPQSLAAQSLSELQAHLSKMLEIRCHRWTDASLADAAAMLSYSLLKRFLNHEFPSSDEATLHNSLLKGLRDVVSGTPMLKLWNLSRMIRADTQLRALFGIAPGPARDPITNSAEILLAVQNTPQFKPFRQELDRYLENWGFRCSGELMLTVPSFQERPEALIDILRSYAELDCESPFERLDQHNAERVDSTSQIMAQLGKRWQFRYFPWPKKSFLAKRLLSWTQTAILFRERARLKQALLYSRCRRIVLTIGSKLTQKGLMNQADDAFFLTVQELESLLEGSSMFPTQTSQLIALRSIAHDEFSRHRPPDTFSLPYGAYWKASAEPAPSPVLFSGGSERVLPGVGVCGGVVTARAAVLHDVTEQGRLTSGDILVTRQTDPGWGPVFLLISGLVMERGGMLSHGAILAREYGLPTVVGIADATTRIQPGETITVNGDCGHVELL